MLARLRTRLRVVRLVIINIGSILWAIGHCWITAFGSQEDRFVAAIAGILGAAVILAILNVSVYLQGREDAWHDVETIVASPEPPSAVLASDRASSSPDTRAARR
jgi:Na+/melibiose symporter-like transporter